MDESQRDNGKVYVRSTLSCCIVVVDEVHKIWVTFKIMHCIYLPEIRLFLENFGQLFRSEKVFVEYYYFEL